MNKFLNSKVLIPIVLYSAFFYSTVSAVECNDESPNLSMLKDDYYILDKTYSFSNDNLDDLKNLYKNIKGQWEGKMSFSECYGSYNAPYKKYRHATVSGNVTPNEYLTIDLDMYFREERVSQQNHLAFIDRKTIYDFVSISQNEFYFSEKWRSRTGAQHTSHTSHNTSHNDVRLLENIYRINYSRKHLEIEILYYSNGIFIGREELTLSR